MRENIESTLMMKTTMVREKEKREKHTVVHCVLLTIVYGFGRRNKLCNLLQSIRFPHFSRSSCTHGNKDYVLEYLSTVEKLNLLHSYSVITTAQNQRSLTVNERQHCPKISTALNHKTDLCQIPLEWLKTFMCLNNGVQKQSMSEKSKTINTLCIDFILINNRP